MAQDTSSQVILSSESLWRWDVATCLEVEESLESSDVILHQCEVLVLDCSADLHNGNDIVEWENGNEGSRNRKLRTGKSEVKVCAPRAQSVDWHCVQ